MSNLFDYSIVPASNNAASPNGAAEGMQPSGLNDTMRQMMANAAAAYVCYSAGGTADAQTVTMSPVLAAYSNKVRIAFIPVANNTGACTLNVNSLGAVSIKMPDGTNPPAAALTTTMVAVVQHNGTNFVLTNPAAMGAHVATTIELGHASDTTLARVSAGVVSIEGVTIATATNTLTLTGKTISGGTISGTIAGSATWTGSPTYSGLTPRIDLVETDGAADNQVWRIRASTEALRIGTVSDDNLTQVDAIVIDRTGTVIDEIDFTTTSLRHGNVEIPTISSNHTLTTKTIALGSNTVSGTMAQFDTACTDGNFVYQSGALGTPASGTLTNCTGLPQSGTVGLTTADSPQFTAVNIGHATDTTISRSSAGVIAVEGVTVPLNSITNTHTCQQIELGAATDTTLTRPAAGRVQIEGREVVTAAADATVLTSTIAELNKVDDSVAAVSGYVSGMRVFIRENGGSTTTFDVSTNVTESTFESVGPTGSLATNIWSAMDTITAGARIAIIRCEFYALGTESGTNILGQVFVRMTGDSTAASNSNRIQYIQKDNNNLTEVPEEGDIVEVYVPLDSSRRFDITWSCVNEASVNINIYLVGFIL